MNRLDDETTNSPMPVFALATSHGETGDYATTVFRLWEKSAAADCRRCPVCRTHEVRTGNLLACAVTVEGRVDGGTLHGQDIGDFTCS